MIVAALSEAELRALLARIVQVPEARIEPSTRFVKDLGMDSLTSLDLLSELEEEHDIEISQEDARHLQTFGDLVAFVAKLEE